jgi:hypothetical protein
MSPRAAINDRNREPDHVGWESVCKWCYRLSVMTVGWWILFYAMAWIYDQWAEVSR